MSRLTGRQELFCRELVRNGGNVMRAYRTVYGPKPNRRVEAKRSHAVWGSARVRARYQELLEPVQEKAIMTLEQHLARLDELSKAAQGAEQFGPAVTAEVARGKAAGITLEKTKLDLTSTDGSMTPKPAIDASRLSDAVLAEIMAARNADQ